MKFHIEGTTTYPEIVEDSGDGEFYVEAVSDGPNEPLSLRFYVGPTLVATTDAGELLRAITYARQEKTVLDASMADFTVPG